jgi:hypothetical protein
MRVYLFILVLLFITGRATAQGPTWLWSQHVGGTRDDIPAAVATDGTGNTITLGSFEGTIQLGAVTLTCPVGSTRNLYLAKYNTQGTLIWATNVGNAGPGNGYRATGMGLTTDMTGNIYIAGLYSGSITFGNTTLSSGIGPVGFNGFLAKYSASGGAVWARDFSSPTGSSGYNVSTDLAGNVFVVGRYTDAVIIGTASLNSVGRDDIFLAKYTGQGTFQWARSMGGPFDDFVYGLCTDAQGNVYLSGSFDSTANFGTQGLLSHGSSDAYLVKCNSQGTVEWARNYGGLDYDYALNVAVSAAGNVYLVGAFGGASQFSSTSTLTSLGGIDGFILKCDGQGNLQWANQVGGTGNDELNDVVTAVGEVIYAHGSFIQTITVGSQTLASAGGSDVVLLRYDGLGRVVWAQRNGGSGDEGPFGLASAGNGLLFQTVSFTGTTQFGPFTTPSRGGYDAVVMQVQDNTPLSTRLLQAASWRAYPNPFSSRLTIEFPQARPSHFDWHLLDATGRLVVQQNSFSASGQAFYDLALPTALPPGTYWLQIKVEGQNMVTRQIVKL